MFKVDLRKTIGFKGRVFIIIASIIAFFLIDLYALFNLQVIDSSKYFVMSEKNRIRTYPLFPIRGEIVDRNGKKIATNTPVYRLMIANARKSKILPIIGNLRQIIDIDMSDEMISERLQSISRNSCLTVKDMLTWEEYAKLILHSVNSSNIILDQVYTRQYAEPLAIGHIVGYIGTNTKNDAHIEGKSGLEYSQNDSLFGIFGNRKIEVDAQMRFVRELDFVKPINGEDLKLSIDLDLQTYIYKILSEHHSAACMVIDLKNAHILSAVSVPGIDANIMSKRISQVDWDKMVNDKYLPMNNRIFRSLYSPGSVFKVFLAYAALETGVISPNERINCTGCTILGTDKFHCWNRSGHGSVDMYQAIACSCDVYFHEVAKRLGIDNIAKYSRMFGFGEHVCLDVANESTGLVPDKQWKKRRYNSEWKEYETILVGTGQGYILSNIAQVTTALARLTTGNINLSPTFLFDKNGNAEVKKLNDKHLQIVKKAMFDVCNSKRGTAKNSCKVDYGIAGKTGSTQVRRLRAGEHGISQKLLKWEDRDHALFGGFAPYKNPRYVVAVVVEHGGGGAAVAAPIVRKIFDWLMKHEHAKNNKI